MFSRFFLLLLVFTCSATFAAADSIDIGFNDESFQFIYEHALSGDEYGTVLGSGRFLYNDDEETTLGSLGLDFVGEPGNIAGLKLGAGAKLYLGDTDPSVDYINLAVGLRGSYILPQLQGLGISGGIYYAPEIFSFRDSEHLLDTDLRLTYAVLPKVKLYLGYQNIRLDVEGADDTWSIDEGLRIGFVGIF